MFKKIEKLTIFLFPFYLVGAVYIKKFDLPLWHSFNDVLMISLTLLSQILIDSSITMLSLVFGFYFVFQMYKYVNSEIAKEVLISFAGFYILLFIFLSKTAFVVDSVIFFIETIVLISGLMFFLILIMKFLNFIEMKKNISKEWTTKGEVLSLLLKIMSIVLFMNFFVVIVDSYIDKNLILRRGPNSTRIVWQNEQKKFLLNCKINIGHIEEFKFNEKKLNYVGEVEKNFADKICSNSINIR